FAGERRARLSMETEYPWSGAVRIAIQETDGSPWSLSLRLPEWANGATLQVNGVPLATYPTRHGYAIVERTWQAGDVIDLTLPMAPRFTEAHPWVDPTRNSLTIERGPLVYCLEQPDQDPAEHVLNVEIDPTSPPEESWRPDLLGGVVTIEAHGNAFDLSAWDGRLYAPLGQTASLARRPTRLTAIPYYAWANRGAAAMRVWIPRGG
ncbi:MAG TPA: glycoside hydrolase family 127 protein, partial [Chloroflexota bacterium]|nr:glycoside hydrolase family 127 protein [Chloroflexota bacterium]